MHHFDKFFVLLNSSQAVYIEIRKTFAENVFRVADNDERRLIGFRYRGFQLRDAGGLKCADKDIPLFVAVAAERADIGHAQIIGDEAVFDRLSVGADDAGHLGDVAPIDNRVHGKTADIHGNPRIQRVIDMTVDDGI